ncbi:hypothetical protein B566_EDAN000848 [Ephemera danica]|nr:hypothetical protein B566_EDAN000848 [Ephemera danica]
MNVLMIACLHIESYADSVGCIRYLIEQVGVDVNFQDSKGVCDVNEVDANGDTCFTLCSGVHNTSLLKYFIEEHSLNVDYQNNKGETALFRAVSKGCIDNGNAKLSQGEENLRGRKEIELKENAKRRNRETISSERESESCSSDQSSGKYVTESKIINLRQGEGEVIQLQGNARLSQVDENMSQRKEIELQGNAKLSQGEENLRGRTDIELQGNAKRRKEKKRDLVTVIQETISKHVKENKETLTAVATVPLQTKILALTYSDEIELALSTEHKVTFDLQSLSLYSLYNNFIDMHINRCIEEKYKLHESSYLYQTTKDNYTSELNKWEALACKEIFPSIEMTEVRTTDTDLQKLQQVGIIRTPLINAAEEGHTKIVKLLHDHGASIHKKVFGESADALFFAASAGHIETDDGCIRYLVEQAGADVNLRNERGKTALMFTIKKRDNIDILKYLIQHGADITALDLKEKNAAMYAAMYGQLKTLKFLIELGVDVVNKVDASGDTCFTLCSGAENSSVLQYFIEEHNPNLDYQNYEGETALFRAVLRGRFDNVKLLITHNASVNICNNKGDTALPAAVYKQVNHSYLPSSWQEKTFHGIVSYLVQHGADINQQNHLGSSVLHSMLHIVPEYDGELDFIVLINLLVELGADIDLKNNEGVTPAMMAQEHENPAVKSHFEELIKDKAASA